MASNASPMTTSAPLLPVIPRPAAQSLSCSWHLWTQLTHSAYWGRSAGVWKEVKTDHIFLEQVYTGELCSSCSLTASWHETQGLSVKSTFPWEKKQDAAGQKEDERTSAGPVSQ